MIICRTPFRVSFFGGGSDYPAWYRENGGTVLATTIDKYCYLTCRYLPPFFEHRIRLIYRQIEMCNSIEEICHPVIREVMAYLKIDRGIELHHDGDLPARSGMGSSSAFTVGLLHILHALKGKMVTKKQLASESIYVEQELLRETVGSQDQVMAAYGGLRQVKFLPNGEISVNPVILPAERIREFQAYLMLFYTGIARTASSVAKSYVEDIGLRRQQLRLMGEYVEKSLEILGTHAAIEQIGHMLHNAWQVKRSLSSQVSNPQIDALYERARSAGAIGGKLTGAGGGGFLLLFAPPSKHNAIIEKLGNLLHVPFKFETDGSQIIFFEPEVDYRDAEKARHAQTDLRFQEYSDAA